jgi:hypothetical protein
MQSSCNAPSSTCAHHIVWSIFKFEQQQKNLLRRRPTMRWQQKKRQFAASSGICIFEKRKANHCDKTAPLLMIMMSPKHAETISPIWSHINKVVHFWFRYSVAHRQTSLSSQCNAKNHASSYYTIFVLYGVDFRFLFHVSSRQ